MRKKCLAMLLAGGQGSRLGIMTLTTAKPAIPFGGKYRIIDFPLSNCSNSGIDTVGVLTQYQPLELNTYLNTGRPWDLDRAGGGAFVLPPYMSGKTGTWYKGTANAIYQNIPFIRQYNPEHVLVLSGDHIYKMDYSAMLQKHIENDADATVAALTVPWEEASRFGILNTDEAGAIVEFEEKPKIPRSNKASMGIYLFKWEILERYLQMDEKNPASTNDFGKDVLPAMLASGRRMFAYEFRDYWKDVGTIDSLWEAHMDLLQSPPLFDLHDSAWRIYSRNPGLPPHFVGPQATLDRAIVTEGSEIYGGVVHSVIFSGVLVQGEAKVIDSVVMPNALIGKGSMIEKSIICENARIGQGCVIGDGSKVTVVGEGVVIPDGAVIPSGLQVDKNYFLKARKEEAV